MRIFGQVYTGVIRDATYCSLSAVFVWGHSVWKPYYCAPPNERVYHSVKHYTSVHGDALSYGVKGYQSCGRHCSSTNLPVIK